MQERGGTLLKHTAIKTVLAGAVIVMVFLSLFSITAGRYAPAIPVDLFHEAVISDAGCRACHTPGKQAPLRITHTTDARCTSCHRTVSLSRSAEP